MSSGGLHVYEAAGVLLRVDTSVPEARLNAARALRVVLEAMADAE